MEKGFWIGCTAALVAIGGVFWFVFGFWLNLWNLMWTGLYHGVWLSWLFANGWNIFMATPLFWVLVLAVVIGLVLMYFRDEYGNLNGFGATLSVLLVVAIVVVTGRGLWVSEQTGAQYYASTTTYVVEDEENLPQALLKLASSNEATVGIETGEIPDEWVSRVASATGAENVMRRTGDAINNTQLLTDTLSYVYDSEGPGGKWTAIRNGIGQQPIYGVSSWNGTGEAVETCHFDGDNELDKAFGGKWGKNLTDTIAAQFPLFTYDSGDKWGYCDGDQPIIVIPGTTTAGYDTRTVDRAFGVLTIKGSPSGEPVIEHVTDVAPGDFPGPVYPQRLVSQQLGSLAWTAGRHLNWHENFGFEGSSVTSQEGNSSNFLLKDPETGRLYWVTPLKSRSTDSQTLVSYSVTPADEMKSGALNPQKVYVLPDEDPRVVNLDDLQAKVTDAVRTSDPGFFTGEEPGRIVEFLPVTDTTWQVFAEVSGRVKYRIDVTIGSRISTSVVLIDGDETETVVPTSDGSEDSVSCDSPSSLSDAQLASCLSQLANELSARQE